MNPKYQHHHCDQHAAMIRDLRASGLSHPTYLAQLTATMVDTFSRDNPRFDSMRFLAACESVTRAKGRIDR